MNAYSNDPRVTRMANGFLDVMRDNGDRWEVGPWAPGLFQAFPSWGGTGVPRTGFASEAAAVDYALAAAS